MANTIITKNSSTASAVPTSGDLVQGELAVNVTDKRLFTENSSGTVVEVGTNPSSMAVAGNATVGGNLGVGTSSPGYKLEINGSGFASNWYVPQTGFTVGTVGGGVGLIGYGTTGAGGLTNTLLFQANGERMRLDSSGNLGLGGTPSAWVNAKALEIGSSYGAFSADTATTGGVSVSFNAYAISASSWKYRASTYAMRYTQEGSSHSWYTAPSGTAGNAISFTQAMTLDASGNLGIGTSSHTQKLEVSNGSAQFNGGGIDGTFGDAVLFGNTTYSTVQKNRIRSSISATPANNILVFETGNGTVGAYNTSQLVLKGDGNVGIGTSSPAGNLHVSADGANVDIQTSNNSNFSKIRFKGAGGAVGGQISGLGGGAGLAFYSTTTERMRIDSSGNVGIGTSSPGAKLSSNVSGAGSITALNLTNDNGGFAAGTGPAINFGISNTTVGVFGKIEVLTQTAGSGSDSYMALSTRGGDVMGERMRIDSAGNVGIGTNSPTAKFEVAGSGNFAQMVRLRDTSVAGRNTEIAYTSTGPYISVNNSEPLAIYTGGAERMRLDSSGNLLVGQTSSGARLAITQPVADWCINMNTTSAGIQYFTVFRYNGNLIGQITGNNTSTSYTTSSDYRLKEDWQPMTGASERVKALKPVNFAWKADGSRVDGFLAHEAQDVVPECVTGVKDAMRTEAYEVTPAVLDDDGNITTEAVMGEREVPNYQGIDQSKLVPLLTAALQEALTKIDALTARIEALEGN